MGGERAHGFQSSNLLLLQLAAVRCPESPHGFPSRSLVALSDFDSIRAIAPQALFLLSPSWLSRGATSEQTQLVGLLWMHTRALEAHLR